MASVTTRTTGHAPSELLPSTDAVVADAGRCVDWNDTPASYPSISTAGAVACRKKPIPQRMPSSGTWRGRTISATAAGETICPANSARQNRCRSAAVVNAPPSPLPSTGRFSVLTRSPSSKR